MALPNDARQRLVLDADPVVGQRPANRLPGGGLVQPAERELPGPVPERRFHFGKPSPQVGRPRENQQERRFAARRLRGVQQPLPHLRLQRMRLVQQDQQRLAPSRAPPAPPRATTADRRPARSETPTPAARNALRRDLPQPGTEPQAGHEVGRRRNVRPDQPMGVQPLVHGGLPLHPSEQGSLPVAARPVDDERTGNRNAAPQVVRYLAEQRLLRLPPGEIRGRPPVAGPERIADAGFRHDPPSIGTEGRAVGSGPARSATEARAKAKPLLILQDEAHTLKPEAGQWRPNAAQAAGSEAPFLSLPRPDRPSPPPPSTRLPSAASGRKNLVSPNCVRVGVSRQSGAKPKRRAAAVTLPGAQVRRRPAVNGRSSGPRRRRLRPARSRGSPR